jgi:hypothetical protein
MKLHKAISIIFLGLFLIYLSSGLSNAQNQGNYIGEYCFDMVNTETILYDLRFRFTGLLRLTVFSAPSGIYTVNGSLTRTEGGGGLPLVGTAMSANDSLRVSLTGSTGFYDIPSVDFYTTIWEGVQGPILFFGLAHRYIPLGIPLGAPPPADLKEIGHQPIAGTLTPRECP